MHGHARSRREPASPGTGALAGALSAKSLFSILSFASVGSILSAGSILSIGSAGSNPRPEPEEAEPDER